MISTYTGLNTALSGLEAAQAALDTTGENISNANTPGYSRETVNLVEAQTTPITDVSQYGATAYMGTGVDISSIQRQRDQFLDVQYRTQNSTTQNDTTNASELSQVQTAVNEPSTDGISNALSQFWSAWSTLANNPSGSSSAAALQNVVDTGTTLAQTFNQVASQISTVQSQASEQYASLTGSSGEVEQYANQLASLNSQIASETAGGANPNTLLDQRDQVLDNLSGLAKITVTNNSDGSVTVGFGDAAQPIVNGSTVNWPQTLTSASGGQLGSLLDTASSTGSVGTLLSSLNSVAGQVISSVNALQPSSPFFSGTDASSIGVSATTSTIQTSSSATSGADLATQIAGLQGGTADQDYSAFVSQVGSAVQSAQSSQSTAQSVLTAIDNQRQSVSGVSLDEEMTNLISEQQAYEASARMMNAINSTISTLISAVGGAGM